MAFLYDAGLRIRPPEPMPECIAGETPQDYFSRVLTQCSLESATSAENNSGDSAPTPFNLGQVQADVARNTADINALEQSVGDIQTTLSSNEGRLASGSVSYALGATTAAGSFPAEGSWKAFFTPIGQKLDDFHASVGNNSFTVTFAATAAAGTFDWFAIRE